MLRPQTGNAAEPINLIFVCQGFLAGDLDARGLGGGSSHGQAEACEKQPAQNEQVEKHIGRDGKTPTPVPTFTHGGRGTGAATLFLGLLLFNFDDVAPNHLVCLVPLGF